MLGALGPGIVYVLCFATSSACALLLGRAWRRSRTRLLLWSTICFALLAANNFAVTLDLLVFPDRDFQLLRLLLALGAVAVLLFAFVWDLGKGE